MAIGHQRLSMTGKMMLAGEYVIIYLIIIIRIWIDWSWFMGFGINFLGSNEFAI